MKKKLYYVSYIIFIFLTFVGAFYVLATNANAGYAIIPLLFSNILKECSSHANESIKKEMI